MLHNEPQDTHEEYEGHQLLISSTNTSGYWGVRKDRSNFRAYVGDTCIGSGFATAKEAAVALAKYKATGERARAPAPAPDVYEEYEGHQLLISSTNTSGYSGVRKSHNNFRACVGGTSIGSGFATAKEAAVALAKYKATGERPRAPAPAPDVYEEYEGHQLLISSTNTSGYWGVRRDRSNFRAHVGDTCIGSGFATAKDAAVALAKYRASNASSSRKRSVNEDEEPAAADSSSGGECSDTDEEEYAAPRSQTLDKISSAVAKLGEIRKKKRALEDQKSALEEEEERLILLIASLSNPAKRARQHPASDEPAEQHEDEQARILSLVVDDAIQVPEGGVGSNGMAQVRQALTYMRLDQYSHAFEVKGYTSLPELMAALEANRVDEVATAVGMKQGHGAKFAEWLKEAAKRVLRGDDRDSDEDEEEMEVVRTHEQRLLGRRVRVYWAPEETWYSGKIREYNSVTSMHTVLYDDGDLRHEPLQSDPLLKWELL
jgi:hypothetical protein